MNRKTIAAAASKRLQADEAWRELGNNFFVSKHPLAVFLFRSSIYVLTLSRSLQRRVTQLEIQNYFRVLKKLSLIGPFPIFAFFVSSPVESLSLLMLCDSSAHHPTFNSTPNHKTLTLKQSTKKPFYYCYFHI